MTILNASGCLDALEATDQQIGGVKERQPADHL